MLRLSSFQKAYSLIFYLTYSSFMKKDKILEDFDVLLDIDGFPHLILH